MTTRRHSTSLSESGMLAVSARISIAVIGVGLALTSATQLRLPVVPLGAGEGLVAAWLFSTAVTLVWFGRLQTSTEFGVFASFWLVSLFALFSGWIVGVSARRWEPPFSRDAIAMILAALVTASLLALPRPADRVAGAARVVTTALVLPLAALLAVVATGRTELGPVELTFGFRFSGWAENPNQVALLVAPLPFFAARFAAGSTGVTRAFYILVGLLALAVGIASLSDALWLAWIVAGIVVANAWWLRSAYARYVGLGRRVLATAVVPVLVASGLVASGPRLMDLADRFLRQEYSDADQGADRFARWRYGLEASSASPLVGHGPGAFSGDTRPFAGSEAHNTFVDWLASTGLVGLVALLLLLSWICIQVVKSGTLSMAGAFAALMVFILFHYVARQPAFWFFLVTIATLSRADAKVG